MSSTSATTTYSFTYTTFTNPTPVAFTKPTEFPSIFSFGSAVGCSSNTASATATATASPAVPVPSNAPLDHPLGLEAACVISNDAAINDHAFWDLYTCCKGADMVAFGSPMPCTAQCKPKDGQTWQELGECLSKKVEVVVCKPAYAEIPRASTSQSASNSHAHSTVPWAGSASSPGHSGGATSAFSAQATSSKAALVVFGILALGSAAGMLL